MTRTGKRAPKEQRAASKYLGSLDDSLAPWVRSTGPVDAYATSYLWGYMWELRPPPLSETTQRRHRP
jgi:hypothetical protein